jgi:peptidoglycan/xylan/chitin deacetylase (PgdA/CDA1 family)
VADGDRTLNRRSVLRAAGLVGLAAVATGAGSATADQASVARGRRLAAAAGVPGPRGAVHVLWRARTTERVVALSFDDGPSGEYTPDLLDLLDREGVRATFCVVGRRVTAAPDIFRREVDSGHEIVNHTWTHADLSALPPPRVDDEIRRTDDWIARVTGSRPALVRPPYGRVSGSVLAAAAHLEHDILLWDAQAVERGTVAQDVAHLVGALQPGQVVLAHDQGPARRRIGMASVRPFIRAARERGYTFVTASELVALDLREAGAPQQ